MNRHSEDRIALLRYVGAMSAKGDRIPCHDGTLQQTAGWTDDDPAHQHAAARRCMPCPALGPCREFGLTYQRSAGVYGGLTRRRTPGSDQHHHHRGATMTTHPSGTTRPADQVRAARLARALMERDNPAVDAVLDEAETEIGGLRSLAISAGLAFAFTLQQAVGPDRVHDAIDAMQMAAINDDRLRDLR